MMSSVARQMLNEAHVCLRNSQLRNISYQHSTTNQHIAELCDVGYTMLPNFLGQEECERLKSSILQSLIKYRKFVKVDAQNSDHRLFGLDEIDEGIRAVTFDPRALDLINAYEGQPYSEGFSLCAWMKASDNNIGSGGGWHRDSASFKQTKLLLYLTNVSTKNGPFQYVKGSHRSWDVIRKVYRYGFKPNQYRFTEAEIAPLLEREANRVATIVAPAGTAFIADTRGIHRGAPILEGDRVALTTYLWFGGMAPSHIRANTLSVQMRRR